jgi:hypothetical protein
MLTKTVTSYSNVLEKVVTPTSLILIDDDVVKVYTNPDVDFNHMSAKENVEAIWGLVKNRKIFHLVVPDSATHISMGTDEYGDERFESIKKGEALVIKTLGHRILAKAFMQSRRHKYPIRVFDCESEALKWFDSLRESE